jgi:hypothetical protein
MCQQQLADSAGNTIAGAGLFAQGLVCDGMYEALCNGWACHGDTWSLSREACRHLGQRHLGTVLGSAILDHHREYAVIIIVSMQMEYFGGTSRGA